MTFYYFEDHTSYRPSYMHAHLLSHFPLVSVSLFAVGVKRRRRQCWVLSYLEESSLKWATVIHQLPSSPWRPCGFALSLEIPQDSALFLYLRFILFPSLHISLSVSLSAALLLWPLALAVSLVSSPASVCGDDFLLDANANFLHCQRRTTETLHTVLRLFLLCCLRTPSAAVTPFPFLPPLTFLYFLISCSSGWTRWPTTHPSRRATPALCASQTLTPAPTPSRCRTGTCSSTPETSLSWVCPLRSRSSTTG